MKNRYIFDAGALALYFAGNDEVKDYFNEVFDTKVEGFVLDINLAEFYYKTAEVLGLEVAEIRYRMVRNSELKQLSAMGEVTREAAIVKLKNKNKLSLADSFLIAEAEDLNAKIITTDKSIKEVATKRTIYIKII